MILEQIDPYADKNVTHLCRLAHIKRYEKATKFLTDGDRVLDAGCGYGYGSRLLSKHASRVISIDSSPNAIEYARKNYSEENIEYFVGDLEDFDLSPLGSFDLIVFFEVIEHLHEPGIVLQKFRNQINPRGDLLVSTPNGRNPYIKNPHHIKEYTEREMREILYENGFRLKEVLGQYPLLGSLTAMVRRIKGDSSDTDKHFISSRELVSSIPFVPEIFSKLYTGNLATLTSRGLYFAAEPRN